MKKELLEILYKQEKNRSHHLSKALSYNPNKSMYELEKYWNHRILAEF